MNFKGFTHFTKMYQEDKTTIFPNLSPCTPQAALHSSSIKWVQPFSLVVKWPLANCLFSLIQRRAMHKTKASTQNTNPKGTSSFHSQSQCTSDPKCVLPLLDSQWIIIFLISIYRWQCIFGRLICLHCSIDNGAFRVVVYSFFLFFQESWQSNRIKPCRHYTRYYTQEEFH